MKKLFFILTLPALLIPALVKSQSGQMTTDDSKIRIGLNVGYCSPSGAFSSTDATKEPVLANHSADSGHIAGYATGGFHFNVNITFMFTPNIGLMLSAGGSMNGYDIGTLNANWAAAHGGTSYGINNSGNYYVGEYLIGPYICIPASDKLNVELKGLVGVTGLNYPTLSYNSSFFGINETGSYTVSNSSEFGYNVGLGLEYMASDAVGFHVDVCYGGTMASYPNHTESYTSGLSSGTYVSPTAMAMSVGLLELTVGVSFHI